MNFSQDYTDLRCIHILLVGVELLSKARLEYYKDLLSSNNSITLANINFSRETSEAINSMLSLNPEDEMMYKFHTTEIGVSNFPLQTHKTFLGVYGIGENVENVLSAYKYVKEIAKNFQNLIEWRLFCFEPRLEDNIFESKAPKLILFHPNIPVEKLVMNIGIVLQDLSSMILSGIVNNLIEYMGKECILMQGETDISKMKRRKQGRFNKILGDALFLLGNLQEAQKKYEDSLDKHKNQGDWIWMGATYESLACISCYKNDYEQAFARFSEAENNYSKVRNGKLNIECQFKFARFIVQTGKKVKAVKKLARLLDFHLEGIDLNDKMLISKNLGLFCKQIGFERKAGFFMKLAASGCVDIEEFNEAHELLKMSAEAYQVTEEKFTMNEKTKEFDRSLYIVRENLKPWMRGDYTGWRNLQKITLEHLKAIAKKLGDTDSSVKYTWNLLLNSITDPDFQDQLRIELEQDAIHVQSNMNFRSPVQLISLVPIENKLEVDILVPGDIFLHNPWVKKKLNWIKGSVHSVLAVMQHKLSFDLHIEHTKLIIEGEAECIPSKL
jgi:tetratricopeptide (TPR) repeat protein